MSISAQNPSAPGTPAPTTPPSRSMKLRMLAELAVAHPVEFFDRVRTIVEYTRDRSNPRASHPGNTREEMIACISQAVGANLNQNLSEPQLREVEDAVAERQKKVASFASFPTSHDADFALARMCYSVCRARRPTIVLETGVGYGVTTAFILKALAVNDHGELWSVDLPPLGRNADEQVGFLVPPGLRNRWHLVRGSSRRVLPRLLTDLGELDVFVHDSLHTYKHMQWEFRAAWPKLHRGGVLISDDVDYNRAFEDFSASVGPSSAFCVPKDSSSRDQQASFGMIMKTT
jgi:predicted O-methyltransferase YrrM